jgi:LPS-assembly lipoprotein
MVQRRRLHLLGAAAAAASLLAGCGFHLRQAPNFAFASLYLGAGEGSGVGNELRRNLESTDTLRLLDRRDPPATADVVLDLLDEHREKVIVARSSSGQVREFQLRSRIRFRLRTPQGRELIPETELAQQRDISFNESAVLAKEAEENLLYRDMQTDLVQQLIRRLAAVKAL